MDEDVRFHAGRLPDGDGVYLCRIAGGGFAVVEKRSGIMQGSDVWVAMATTHWAKLHNPQATAAS